MPPAARYSSVEWFRLFLLGIRPSFVFVALEFRLVGGVSSNWNAVTHSFVCFFVVFRTSNGDGVWSESICGGANQQISSSKSEIEKQKTPAETDLPDHKTKSQPV